MSRESKLVKNTAIIAVGNVCMKCISFLMFPLYTAVLTASEYGTVDLIIVAGTLLVSVISLRLHDGLFRFLVEARGNRNEIKKVVSTICCFLAGVIAICMLLAWLLSCIIEYEYIIYIALYAVMTVCAYVATSIARGLGDNITYTIGSCIGGSLRVILNVLFLTVAHMGIKGMLYAEFIASASSAIYPTLRLKLWSYFSIKNYDPKCIKQVLRYSLPLVPYTLCWWVISAASRMIISGVLGTRANGIYSVANKFSSTFTLATDIFKTSWSESAAENVNALERNRYYHSIINRAICFYSSANLGILALMPFVFPLLINNEFEEAYLYVPFLMVSAFFNGVANLFGSIYTALKMTREIALITVFSAIINVAINFMLLPKIGLYGAAMAAVVAYGLIVVVQYKGVGRMIDYRIPAGFLARELLVYIAVLCAYYSQTCWFQITVLAGLIPYCIVGNWGVIKPVILYVIQRCKIMNHRKG